MALNFPDNPTPGQKYTDPNNLVWEFSGVVWNPITAGISGFSGSSGYSGYSGTSGYSGISGISGFSSSGVAISVYYEGNLLTNAASSFNFAGSEVVATNVSQAVTVTIEPPIVYNNSAWSWGRATNGQLGDNTTVSKSSPVSVVGGFTDWSEVSGGVDHSLGLRTNGTAWSWGQPNNGRLGNDTIAGYVSSPVSVVGGFTNWCNISTGTNFSLAIRTNGTIWGWGLQSQGQLGDGTAANKSSPVSVVGGFTDWCQVSAGSNHSAAVRTNGTIWAWGCNGAGRLGNDNTTDVSSPVSVVGGYTDWCGVSAGGGHTLGLNTSGVLWAWGYGSSGRLGDNTIANKSSPVSVVGGFTDWCQISAGSSHAAAVRTNGTLWTWGSGSYGKLGINALGNRSSPVSVVGGFTDWCQVSASVNSTFGVRTNGTLWAWGYGSYGRLGNNSTTARSSPVSVVGGFTDWFRVACSIKGYQTLAIRSTIT